MNTKSSRQICILLALVLVLSFISINWETTEAEDDLGKQQDSANPVVYYFDPVSNKTLTVTDYTMLDSTITIWGTDEKESYVVIGDSDILVQESRINVFGKVNVILLDDASLSAQQGITVPEGCSLSIYAGSMSSTDRIEGTGVLSALDHAAQYGFAYGAAIGGFARGDLWWEPGTINIYGGNVIAIARNEYNCAIGGAYVSIGNITSGGILNVYGGIVKAIVINNGKGAGIGGNGGTFSFFGGTVYANGGAEGEEGTYWFSPSDAIGAPAGLTNHGTLNLGKGMTLFMSEDKGMTYTSYTETSERYQYMKIANTLLGDSNCDGEITAADASLILRTCVGLCELSQQGSQNADVNGDEEISAEDAALILRYIVGLIDVFPAEKVN